MALEIVHGNVARPEKPAESVATKVTLLVPDIVGVPEMVPVEELRVRPAGRPVADHVAIVAIGEESVAAAPRVTAAPETEDCAPGSVTETTLVTVQAKEAWPVEPDESVATRVTLEVPAAVGVPEMVPVEELRVRPAGRPVADQESIVAIGEESVASAPRVTGTSRVADWPPGSTTETMLVTVQAKEAWPVEPDESVAARVTLEVPAAVGVPEMVPVEGSMPRPAGRPVADQVSVADGEESVAVAPRVTNEPDVEDWSPGSETETMLVTVQAKEAWPVEPDESVATRVTLEVPAAVGVPEMVPVEELRVRPAGRPVADQVSVADGEESVAVAPRVTAAPETEDCAPGSETETMLVTVQAKEAWPVEPDESVAARVTLEVPAAVGVPEMVPVEGSMPSPAGRPVADQVSVADGEESVAVAPRVTAAPESRTGPRGRRPRRCWSRSRRRRPGRWSRTSRWPPG